MMMKKMMMGLMAVLFIASLVYAVQGVGMHIKVSEEEDKFHGMQRAYFSLAKAERDGAETGSVLNQNLVAIQNYPSELLRLKLVGVGKILTGIYILLFAILLALIIMPVRLGMIIKGKK